MNWAPGDQCRLNSLQISCDDHILPVQHTNISPNKQPTQRYTPSVYQTHPLTISMTSSYTTDSMWVSICPYIPLTPISRIHRVSFTFSLNLLLRPSGLSHGPRCARAATWPKYIEMKMKWKENWASKDIFKLRIIDHFHDFRRIQKKNLFVGAFSTCRGMHTKIEKSYNS